MYWLEDITELYKLELIPNEYMDMDEKLNTLSRLMIFFNLIMLLIFNDIRILLFMIIILILISILYYYHKSYNIYTEKYLNEKNLDIIDNKICVKPTKDNPFMNPNLFENNRENEGCPINNSKINKEIDKYFYENVFRDADDIYNKSILKRQFYSVPSSKNPNDREKLGEWLYYREKSCKENNGLRCYNNIYTPLHI